MKGLNNSSRKRLGYIPDPQTDNLFIRIGGGIGIHLFAYCGKKIAAR